MYALYIYLPETPTTCIFVDNVYETTSQSDGGKNSAFHEFMKYRIPLHPNYDNISLKFFPMMISFLLTMNTFSLKSRQQDGFITL